MEENIKNGFTKETVEILVKEKYVQIIVLTPLEAISSKNLKNVVEEQLQKNQLDLVIDLKAVDFMDSFALGELVSILKIVNKTESKLFLVNLQIYIKQLFEITQLKAIFKIFKNIEDLEENI